MTAGPGPSQPESLTIKNKITPINEEKKEISNAYKAA